MSHMLFVTLPWVKERGKIIIRMYVTYMKLLIVLIHDLITDKLEADLKHLSLIPASIKCS